MSGINGEVIGYALIDEDGNVVEKVGDIDLGGEDAKETVNKLVGGER